MIVQLLESFREVKARYDKHASFKIKMQRNHSLFVDYQEVKKQHICCPDAPLSMSTFPFYHTPEFARCIHSRCNQCGMTWIPKIDFSLSDYYSKTYADNVQPFRKNQGKFFSDANSFLKTDTFKRMDVRADKHLKLAQDDKTRDLLDLGPGVGITLRKSKARKKIAYELDTYSQKILKSELKVSIVSEINKVKKVDSIIASHFFEHLLLIDFQQKLADCFRILPVNGRLVLEVPRGAEQIARVENGERNGILFEPHTISFSSFALYKFLQDAGFRVECITRDAVSSHLLPENLPDFQDPNLVAVAVKS